MAGAIKLDAIDRSILRELQRNGRLSVQELSERVGLTASPCARRVRMLEEVGVLAGYAALVDEAKLGFGVTVFVSVKLDEQIDEALQRFEAAVAGYPEVVDCWLMTGKRDYLMRVVVEDLGAFEACLTRRLTRTPGVSSIESSLPLRRVKSGTARMA